VIVITPQGFKPRGEVYAHQNRAHEGELPMIADYPQPGFVMRFQSQAPGSRTRCYKPKHL